MRRRADGNVLAARQGIGLELCIRMRENELHAGDDQMKYSVTLKWDSAVERTDAIEANEPGVRSIWLTILI